MTPLQALEAIKKALNIEWGNDTCNNDLKPEIDLLTSIITPPTSDEVCEELERYFYQCVGKASPYIKYIQEEKKFIYITEEKNYDVIALDRHGYIAFQKTFPHYLISLIGRFYEAQE